MFCIVKIMKPVLLGFCLWMTDIFGGHGARASTLEELLKSRHLAVSSCSIGRADVHLVLMLDTDADRQHAVVVVDDNDGTIMAWQRFELSENGAAFLESSSGIAMADLLSGWRDFLLDKPLQYRIGFSGMKRPYEFVCPENADSPW